MSTTLSGSGTESLRREKSRTLRAKVKDAVAAFTKAEPQAELPARTATRETPQSGEDTDMIAGVAVPRKVAEQVRAVLAVSSGAFLLTEEVLARTTLHEMSVAELERIIHDVDLEAGPEVNALDWAEQLTVLKRIVEDPDAATPPSWGLRPDPDGGPVLE